MIILITLAVIGALCLSSVLFIIVAARFAKEEPESCCELEEALFENERLRMKVRILENELNKKSGKSENLTASITN